MNILYVEDEPALAELTKTYLELNGDMHVETIASGIAAIEVLMKRRFDAIVSDYQMPLMDGIELLKHVRSLTSSTPFILFTGKGREEVAIEALNSGANFYLQKGGVPEVQFGELRNAIKQLVERNKAEEALVASEAKYRHLVQSSNSIILTIDIEGRITYMNNCGLHFFGYKLSELVGRSVLESIIDPSDYPDLDMSRIIPTMMGVELPYGTGGIFLARKKNGEEAWISWTRKPFKDQSGKTTEILCIGNDETQHIRTEDGLKESLSIIRATLESIDDGILVVMQSGRVSHYNSKILEMMRIPTSIMESRSRERVCRYLETIVLNKDEFSRLIQEAVTNPPVPLSGHARFRDGTVVEMTATPLMIGNASIGRVWRTRYLDRARTE